VRQSARQDKSPGNKNMRKFKNSNTSISRKIENIHSTNEFTASTLMPVGAPFFVQGEASGKSTYDFNLLLVVSGTTSAANSYQCHYVGARNGAKVNLRHIQVITSATATSLPGDVYLQIVPGTGVTLRYFYGQ
jgi:hypothetical protein